MTGGLVTAPWTVTTPRGIPADSNRASETTSAVASAFTAPLSETDMPKTGVRIWKDKTGWDPLANGPYSRTEWPDKDKKHHPIWVNYETWKTTDRPKTVRNSWLNSLENSVAYFLCLEGKAGSAPKSVLRAGSGYNLLCDTLAQLTHNLNLAGSNFICPEMYRAFCGRPDLHTMSSSSRIAIAAGDDTLLNCTDPEVLFDCARAPTRPIFNDLRKRKTVIVCDSCIIQHGGRNLDPFTAMDKVYESKGIPTPWQGEMLGGGGSTARTMTDALKKFRLERLAGKGADATFGRHVDCHVFITFNGIYAGNKWLFGTEHKTKSGMQESVVDLISELSYYDSPTLTVGPSAQHWGIPAKFSELFDALTIFTLEKARSQGWYASVHQTFWNGLRCFAKGLYDWHCHDQSTWEFPWHIDRHLVRLKALQCGGQFNRKTIDHLTQYCKIGEPQAPTTRLVAPVVVQLESPSIPVKVEVAPNVPSVSATTGAGGAAATPMDCELAAPFVAAKLEEKDEPTSPKVEIDSPPDVAEDISLGPAVEDPYMDVGLDDEPDVDEDPTQKVKTLCHISIDGSAQCLYEVEGQCFTCKHAFCMDHMNVCAFCAEAICLHCGEGHTCRPIPKVEVAAEVVVEHERQDDEIERAISRSRLFSKC